MTMDWMALEGVVAEDIVKFVRQVRTEHPEEHLYAAAVHEFYAEQGGRILSPMISVASEEWLDAQAGTAEDIETLRWDVAAWPWSFDPTDTGDGWVGPVEKCATAGGGRSWDAVHGRYLRAVAAACARARVRLVEDAVVDAEFLVAPIDEEFTLLRLAFARAELAQHFPFALEP